MHYAASGKTLGVWKMTICNRCWPWCRSEPIKNPYEESKSIRPPLTPSNTITTLTITEGKTTLSIAQLTEKSKNKFLYEESLKKDKSSKVGHGRFVSTEVVNMSTILRQPPKPTTVSTISET